jgi:hypothetical protein
MSRAASFAPAQWRQFVLITLGALAIFFGLRALPTGTNLSHMDFRASGTNSIEFCDPANPQFIPVVAVRSPVAMTLRTSSPLMAGQVANCDVMLRTTTSDKAIAPEDLLVVHTQKMHLLIADPSLTDYQHVHPTPGAKPGEWRFSFTPRFGGTYRIFADFTPVATGRGLYASVDAQVAGQVSGPARNVGQMPAGQGKDLAYSNEQGGFRFALTPSMQPLRAGQPIDLKFSVAAVAGGAVPMQPVMGSFAHLVAFDAARSGFAHLHPMEVDLSKPPDAIHPVLNFKLRIPRPGSYVIWAQVNLGGHEMFVPFWFDVVA